MDFNEKEFLVKDIVRTAFRLENDIVIDVHQEKVVAKSGDWLVTYKDGRKKIMTHEQFLDRHIEINDKLQDCLDKEGE